MRKNATRVALLALLAGCGGGSNGDQPDLSGAAGCRNDNDCKASRICVAGQCMEPGGGNDLATGAGNDLATGAGNDLATGGHDLAVSDDLATSGSTDLATAPDLLNPPDLAPVTNAGTLLLNEILLLGMTSDDDVFAMTATTGGVSAVLADGTSKTVIDPLATFATSSNPVIFTYQLAAGTTVSDSVYVYKKGTTPRKLVLVGANPGSYAGTSAATADGTWIMYSDNAIEGGATDVYVAKLDGTGTPIKVASNADTNNANCGVNAFGFGARLFLFYCDAGGASDAGGTNGALLTMVDTSVATPAAVLLSSDATTFGADAAGDKGWFLDSTKQLWVSALTGTPAPTKVTGATAVNSAYIARDGSALMWTNTALHKASLTGVTVGTPVDVAGIQDFLTAAPDDVKFLVSDIVTDATTGQFDIALLSGGTSMSLVTNGSGVLYGPAFTADSQTVLFYDNAANGSADLHLMPVTGASMTLLAPKAWSHVVGDTTKIAYNDNYHAGSNPNGNGKADIWVYDLTTQTKTAVASGTSGAVASPSSGLYATSDRKLLIYDYQPVSAALKGAYSYPLQ